MTKRIALYIIAALGAVNLYAQPVDPDKPRLVVNITVSGMRSIDLERYQNNFGLGGLRLLYEEGLRYNNCQYSYQQTTTPVSLATLATGAQPSTHGIIGHSWFDYVTNEQIELLADLAVKNIEYSTTESGYSSRNLLVPTLSDALLADSPRSQAVTVALDPVSAIVTNGKVGTPFWFDESTCSWASSQAYIEELPTWVIDHNRSEPYEAQVTSKWIMSMHSDLYENSRYTGQKGGYILSNGVKSSKSEDRKERYAKYYKEIISTPTGNDMVASFALLSLACLDLGADDHVDILNVCFDTSRNIVESYGPESIEAEDMYYKLDRTIADMIDYISSEVGKSNVVFVLTSDHGTSPSIAVDTNRFNSRQFEVILNGFLSVRYGNNNWVLGCKNGAVYLNHNAIYQNSLNLAEVQSEAATFALQLQGVSHAITSSALSTSYFGNGYAQKIQNGFYPRRSGDVIINLMPNWIERDMSRLSQSGSMYNYDRAIPLVFYGKGVESKVVSRVVDATSIAPSIASIMGVTEPAAAEGLSLEELTIEK